MEMKNDSKELDRRMESVLHGGKVSSKRVYAVDEALYGRSDGLALKKQSLAEMKTRDQKIRLAKERRGKVAAGADSANVPSSSLLSDPQAQSVMALLAVGTLAAAVGFFFGGSKRQ